jgi:hypothetical protein
MGMNHWGGGKRFPYLYEYSRLPNRVASVTMADPIGSGAHHAGKEAAGSDAARVKTDIKVNSPMCEEI